MKTTISIISFLLITALSACKKDAIPESTSYPFLITTGIKSLDTTGVTLTAEVLNRGTEGIADYGFILNRYGISGGYKLSLLNKTDLDHFQLRISTNLESQMTYSYQAYIQTNKHNVITSPVQFTSLGSNSPVITRFSPSEGFDNTKVVIRGKNFGLSVNDIKVSIGSVQTTIEFFSQDSLVVKIPQSDYSGNAKVLVKLGSRTVTSDQYFKINGPNIENISKNYGYPGDIMTMTGKYFTNNGNTFKVYFGANEVTIIEKTENKVVLVVPFYYTDYEKLKDCQFSIRLVNGLKSTTYKEEFIIKTPWKRKQNPSFVRHYNEKFTGNNTNGYFLSMTEKKLFEYNVSSDIWNTISEYPGEQIYNPVFTHFNNKLFIIGKCSNCTNYDFWEYDLSTKTWRKKNSIPFVFDNTVTFVLNQKLFVVTDRKEIWEYNETVDGFIKKNKFPGNTGSFSSFISQNKAYIVSEGQIWVYDPIVDRWTINSLLPSSNNSQVFDCRARYALYDCTIYKYDLLSDKWIRGSWFPGCGKTSSSFIIGDVAFIGAFTYDSTNLFSYEEL